MSIRLADLNKTRLTEVLPRSRRKLEIKHPGEMLYAEFMQPHAITANALAQALHVPANRITAIVNGQRAVTADTALRLAKFFGTTPDFWLSLQKDYELRIASKEMAAELDTVEPLAA